MTTPAITTDAHGNRYATVHVEELDEWAWLLAQLEDWLAGAWPDTRDDWAQFTGRCGPTLVARHAD